MDLLSFDSCSFFFRFTYINEYIVKPTNTNPAIEIIIILPVPNAVPVSSAV